MKSADKLQIADYLKGTYFTTIDTAKLFDLDIFKGPDEVEAAANEHGVFSCISCGYWTYEDKLIFGVCEDCVERPLNEY